MKLQIFLVFNLLILAIAPVNADSAFVTSEIGVATKFSLTNNLTGFVNYKRCETCKTEHYKITPDIKAYLNNKEVPLSNFVSSRKKPDTLVFVRKSGELAGLKWFLKE
ncbi:MAG: hypothetical protein DIZ80_09900 [endosymbiont of Galathealinum brachiosum]|uniref:Cytochrome c domain-containing protein n=1 Tax=endosymbiont of Galathealinum brachiosum TaxID=2200906 RepID=A0A370DCF6_9GAMM|nr:MAG: hypothetical protein DIZ80_09900 [endosymbiont of Galathealinum brachiosum]